MGLGLKDLTHEGQEGCPVPPSVTRRVFRLLQEGGLLKHREAVHNPLMLQKASQSLLRCTSCFEGKNRSALQNTSGHDWRAIDGPNQ